MTFITKLIRNILIIITIPILGYIIGHFNQTEIKKFDYIKIFSDEEIGTEEYENYRK